MFAYQCFPQKVQLNICVAMALAEDPPICGLAGIDTDEYMVPTPGLPGADAAPAGVPGASGGVSRPGVAATLTETATLKDAVCLSIRKHQFAVREAWGCPHETMSGSALLTCATKRGAFPPEPPQAMLPKWVLNVGVARRWISAAAAAAAGASPPSSRPSDNRTTTSSGPIPMVAGPSGLWTDVTLVVNQHQIWDGRACHRCGDLLPERWEDATVHVMRWRKPKLVHGVNVSFPPVPKEGISPLVFQPGWSPLKNAITLCAAKRTDLSGANGDTHTPAEDERTAALCNQLHPELYGCVQRCLKPICATAAAEAELKLHHYGRHVAHFGRGVDPVEDPELFEDKDAADFIGIGPLSATPGR